MNLVNLTNHPYNLWEEEQKHEAKLLYNEVLDYPFPNVEPSFTEEQISFLAENTYNNVINKFGKNITIHLMGEFTLCFSLLKKFQKENISCVASCTERDVVLNNSGEKVVRFKFKKFRRYE